MLLLTAAALSTAVVSTAAVPSFATATNPNTEETTPAENEEEESGDGEDDNTGTNTQPEKKPVKKVKKKAVIRASSYTKTINSKSFKIKASINSGAKLKFKSSNKKVAKVNSKTGKVKIKGYGTATITISAKAKGDYLAPSKKKIKITVNPPKIKWKSVESTYARHVEGSWKYNKTVTGYQVQVSRSSSFSGKVYKFYYKGKKGKNVYTSKARWDGFLSKKTYYIRIRAMKKAGGKKLYGEWSNRKSVWVK